MKAIQKLVILLLLLLPLTTYSHSVDQSYIYLRIYEEGGIYGKFHCLVSDINDALGINLPKYATDEELEPHVERLKAYLLENAAFSSAYGNHKIVYTGNRSRIWTSNGYFWNFEFHLENSDPVPDNLDVTYTPFIEDDPNQRNMLGIEYNWKAGMINNEKIFALDFGDGNTTQNLDLTETSLWKGFVAMIKQGVWHIWIGLDHILFLLALILPSVVRRVRDEEGVAHTPKQSKWIDWNWKPVERFKPAFMYILKVVTFFTIAHTITLSLAALEIVNLPSRVVECVIALSIGLAAYHNIRPIFKGKDWVIAFLFGLFHGFGFASVLGDLGFRGENLTLSLLGFNIGVEIGQVVIIAAIFPFLFFMRKLKLYPKLLVYLSMFLIIVSLYWAYERAFDIDLPLDEKIITSGGDFLRWIGVKPPLN